MSTYGLCQSLSGTLSAIVAIIVLIFLSPFFIALAIGTLLGLWQHSFSPIWSSLYYALLCDIGIVIVVAVLFVGLIIHDKIFDK